MRHHVYIETTIHHEEAPMATYTTTHYESSDMGWTCGHDVQAFIMKRAAVEGGAFTWDECFGLVTIVRADIPSKLPGHMISRSHDSLFFRGEWRGFSEAARIREQNKRDW
tara:strand:+ start:419 stop:748 length:330 start_codon:yes stop_codon:yes gene_type:complete